MVAQKIADKTGKHSRLFFAGDKRTRCAPLCLTVKSRGRDVRIFSRSHSVRAKIITERKEYSRDGNLYSESHRALCIIIIHDKIRVQDVCSSLSKYYFSIFKVYFIIQKYFAKLHFDISLIGTLKFLGKKFLHKKLLLLCIIIRCTS